MNERDTLIVVGFAAAFAVAYFVFGRAKAAVTGAVNTVADIIAAPLADLAVGPPIQVNGAVRLPGGQNLLINTVIAEGGSFRKTVGVEQYILEYRGVRYSISGRDADGFYKAVKL